MWLRIKNIPLLFAYIIFPVVMIINRAVTDEYFSRNWIDVAFIGWMLLAIASLIIKKRAFRVFSVDSIVLSCFLCTLCLATFLKFILIPVLFSIELAYIPAMMEFKPIFYLAVAVIGVAAFGLPNDDVFIKAGMILSVMIFLSVVLESVDQGRLVRAHGSGEMNYDGFLVLISFFFAIYSRDVKSRRLVQGCLFAGLLLSMSRTALFSVVLCFFLVGKIDLRKKLALALCAILVMYVSFSVRNLPLNDIQSMDRYWMWYSAFDYISKTPSVLLFGLTPGVPIDVDTPLRLQWLWNSQSVGWGITGVYPFHLHAMWLRVLVTWGVVGVSIALFLVAKAYFSSRSDVVKALMIAVSVSSMTMGVFYVSNIDLPLLLALLAERNKGGKYAKVG